MPEEALRSDLAPMTQLPSNMLKDFYSSLKGRDPADEQLEKITKQTLLLVGEVVMWLDHLKTVNSNGKRGAAKAAETRRLKRCSKSAETSSSSYSCGICGALYCEEAEYWIGCDSCDSWFMEPVSMLHRIANLKMIFVTLVCRLDVCTVEYSCVLDVEL